MAATQTPSRPWVTSSLQYATQASTINLTLSASNVPEVVASVELPPNGGTPTLLPGRTPLPDLDKNIAPLTQNGIVFGFRASLAQIWLYKEAMPSTSSLFSNTALPTGGTMLPSPPFPNSTASMSSPTSSTPAVSRASNKTSAGVGSGAAAGIAIGCLLAGALMTALILWFCSRKKKRSRGNDYEASSTALVSREKGFAAQATLLGSGSPNSSPVSGALPLPLEDKAITGEISKISNSIKNHVQSYYHTSRVNHGVLDLDDIQAIGNDLPVSVGTLSTLLGNSATREIALRFCIAWVVCTRIQSSADPDISFLPIELATCSQRIECAHRSSSVHHAIASRWRVMTAELMQSYYVREPFTASDSRNGGIEAALTALENVLQPYADSRMDFQQGRQNLEEILKRSALFAFTLFSQPSEFSFDWKVDQSVKPGELCVFPALVQVSDEAGQSLSPPRPFSEAVVRRLEI